VASSPIISRGSYRGECGAFVILSDRRERKNLPLHDRWGLLTYASVLTPFWCQDKAAFVVLGPKAMAGSMLSVGAEIRPSLWGALLFQTDTGQCSVIVLWEDTLEERYGIAGL